MLNMKFIGKYLLYRFKKNMATSCNLFTVSFFYDLIHYVRQTGNAYSFNVLIILFKNQFFERNNSSNNFLLSMISLHDFLTHGSDCVLLYLNILTVFQDVDIGVCLCTPMHSLGTVISSSYF